MRQHHIITCKAPPDLPAAAKLQARLATSRGCPCHSASHAAPASHCHAASSSTQPALARPQARLATSWELAACHSGCGGCGGCAPPPGGGGVGWAATTLSSGGRCSDSPGSGATVPSRPTAAPGVAADTAAGVPWATAPPPGPAGPRYPPAAAPSWAALGAATARPTGVPSESSAADGDAGPGCGSVSAAARSAASRPATSSASCRSSAVACGRKGASAHDGSRSASLPAGARARARGRGAEGHTRAHMCEWGSETPQWTCTTCTHARDRPAAVYKSTLVSSHAGLQWLRLSARHRLSARPHAQAHRRQSGGQYSPSGRHARARRRDAHLATRPGMQARWRACGRLPRPATGASGIALPPH